MNRAIRAKFILFNRSVSFIIDSGASCCIIDRAYIPKWVTVDDRKVINLRGVNGTTVSLGCVYTHI